MRVTKKDEEEEEKEEVKVEVEGREIQVGEVGGQRGKGSRDRPGELISRQVPIRMITDTRTKKIPF